MSLAAQPPPLLGLLARNLLIMSARGNKPRSYSMAFDGPVAGAASLQGSLAKVPGVKRLSITPSGVNIVVRSDGVWPSVRSEIESRIYRAFDPDTPHSPAELRAAILNILSSGQRSPSNIRRSVELLIRIAINPYLARDGGSCSYKSHEFTDQGLVVHIGLHGNCSGCSKSMTTMNDFVTKEFKRYIPGLYAVKHTDE